MEFFGRIQQLISSLDPQFAVLAGLVALVFVAALSVLAISGARKALLLCLVLCMPFAGFAMSSVDAAATLLRWLVMFFLALSCVCGVRSPGSSNLWLGVFGLITLAMAAISPDPLVALQFSVLWIVMTWLVGAALAHDIREIEDIHAMLKILLVGAGLFVLLAMVHLPVFRGGMRFAGSSTGAPVFVITGGLLLPVALWSVLYLKQTAWRYYALGIAVLIAALLAFSGQRTGTYAAVIACVPVAWRFTPRSLAITCIAVISIVATVWVASLIFPEQIAFAVKRYSSVNVTGREVRWQQGWEICLEEPLIAHGTTSRVDFHNMYLEAWYRGGLQGLFIVLCALATIGWQAWKLCRSQVNQQFRALGRLTLGILLFVLASGIPEDKLISPSNMTILMTVLFGVIASRANVIRRRERMQAMP